MPSGVEVNTRNVPPSRGAPTATDTLFLVAKFASGDLLVPHVLNSMLDVENRYGARTGASIPGYDLADAAFREGVRKIVAIRYSGTSPNTLDDALAVLTKDLGPGSLAAPDETPTAATYGKLLDHAALTNRFALLDVAVGDTVAAMTTKAGLYTGIANNKDYGALFGPWVDIPAPAGVAGGTARQVPASAIVAGLIARSDALGNPNRAPAGRDFPLQYALDLTRAVTDDERDSLLNVGVNMIVNRYGVLQLYGFQTGVTQNIDNPFWQANCARARMWLKAKALDRGENYMFKPIDGRGLLANALKTDLDEVCLGLYEANGLYGETPADAFVTNVGASINTEASIAQGELHATVETRLTLHAKRVLIDLVSVPVTGRVTPN